MSHKVAVKWEPIDLLFIRKNFGLMTLSALLDAVNDMMPSRKVGMSGLRYQLKRMGLSKNGSLINWNPIDVDFLIHNYAKIGNVEMADILTKKRRSFRFINGKKVYRTFTKKHIEKKIKLLGLHRTHEQILKIKKRNLKTTNYKVLTSEDNLWTRGIKKACSEESIKIWTVNGVKRIYIKINGSFTPYTRWFYHNFVAPVPKGYMVYHLDCDVLNNEPENLACCPRMGLHSKERFQGALVLLAKRENKILEKLPVMNYDKQREEIRQTNAELNRVRKIQEKIKQKVEQWEKEETHN